MSYEQLERLAFELRAEMVATTSKRGGHLASSLGAVEIIIALLRVFNGKDDRIVFDVGHQAYAWKMLTGRLDQFSSLRSFGGISGFPKITESPYDAHDAGHASDSLSIALGYALARDLSGKDNNVVALVGDASFTGGMALEALNYIGHRQCNMTIILNDNGMSISPNVGAFSAYLGKARLSKNYTTIRDGVEDRMTSSGRFGRLLMDTGNAVKESVKQLVIPGSQFFEGFGVKYIGPIDGHDIHIVEEMLLHAREVDGPVIIHAVTKKGKGYPPAEKHPDTFHGVGPFDIATGEVVSKPGAAPKWTNIFADELIRQAEADESIVAITAAMPAGTGIDKVYKAFPDRCFDVGIAEENAVTMAAGLALGGKKPVVAIYSTFLQRAFDQITVNVALQKQHVVFAIDRAGLVGADGPTHHGMFDLSYMRAIPGMRIMVPADSEELRDALVTALKLDGPVAIRYPRGSAPVAPERPRELWEPGKAKLLREGEDASILAVGDMVPIALAAADLLEKQGKSVAVYNMRWAKPIDEEAVAESADRGPIYTVEDNTIVGGMGSGVLEVLSASGKAARCTRFGLPDEFVQQGTVPELFESLGLSAKAIAQRIAEDLG